MLARTLAVLLLAASSAQAYAIQGSLLVTSTATVNGNAFSVGGSTLVVKGGNVGINAANPTDTLQCGGKLDVGTQSAGEAEIQTAIGNPENPTYSFFARTDTGMYLVGPNTLGFSAAHTTVAYFSSSGMIIPLQVTAQSTVTVNGNAFSVGRSSFSVLAGMITSLSQPAILAYNTANSSTVANGSVAFKLFWNATKFAQGGMAIQTSSNSVNVPASGLYGVICGADATITAAGSGVMTDLIQYNGSQYTWGQSTSYCAGNAECQWMSVSIIQANAGDTFGCTFYNAGTQAASLVLNGSSGSTFLAAIKIW